MIVSSLQSKAFIELPAAEHFTVALFYGIIAVAIMAAVVYSIKLKVTLTVSPKSPSSGLQGLSVGSMHWTTGEYPAAPLAYIFFCSLNLLS